MGLSCGDAQSGSPTRKRHLAVVCRPGIDETANVPVLVEAAAVRASDRVLDVGAGTGPAAITAARAGARVSAVDPTPELFEQAREIAQGTRDGGAAERFQPRSL